MSDYLDITLAPWRLWEDFMGGLPPLGSVAGAMRARYGRYPRVNAWENEQGLMLEAELPGVDPKQVEVGVEGTELTLKGKLPEQTSDGVDEGFERHFHLPFDVEPAAVKAVYRRGVLILTLPKAASAQRKTISIETEKT
ncbi:MAG: Hsp20/alpha crystallin family protein [Kiritimatiellae bacterium]|nr:Hsp20/alpha crystallin family protein [Kiritimatiellia bacterium]